MKESRRILYLTIAFISLGLGFLGAFLPILPTTPFAILSAYLFSKSSPRLHAWILGSPLLGPLIQQWELYGVIRIRAKIFSTVMIIPLFIYTLVYVDVHFSVKILVTIIGISVLTFIWTRPSKPSTNYQHAS